MKAANKVALNTGILYGRMFITMGITLYSTRLVLNALGSTDYGIFNLIAGVILMLSFLNAAMSTSTQRYLSYHQGKNDIQMQRRVFTNSLVLHIIIGIILVLLLEFASIFLFDGFLNIPHNRIHSARLIYHLMSATVFFTIVAVPFNGALIAHENMLWVAFVNIIETLLKLIIAVVLTGILGDKLFIYGALTEGVSMISLILYATYCFKKYQDCTLKGITVIDKPLMKELGSFAGWNLFGSLCSLGRSQGLAIILNIFLGATVNAAYGIANQVGSQLLFFSNTMLRSINPQIMKSEGAGNRTRVLRLSMIASKFGFFLLACFAIPCIFEMRPILQFWLKDVPDYTVVFCSLILVGTLFNQLTIGLQSALQAVGDIRLYQIVVGFLLLLNLPLAYFLLKSGYSPYSVLIGYATIELIACSVRLVIAKRMTALSISEYVQRVFLREIIPVLASVIICYLSIRYFHFHFLITCIVSVLCFVIMAYFVGLCKDEKEMIDNVFKKVINDTLLSNKTKLKTV